MNLKKIRKDKGISQIKLAEILNVSKNHMSRLENGITDLSTSQIIILCKFLNCSADELLGLKSYEEQAENIIKSTNTKLTKEEIINAKNTLDKIAELYYKSPNENPKD